MTEVCLQPVKGIASSLQYAWIGDMLAATWSLVPSQHATFLRAHSIQSVMITATYPKNSAILRKLISWAVGSRLRQVPEDPYGHTKMHIMKLTQLLMNSLSRHKRGNILTDSRLTNFKWVSGNESVWHNWNKDHILRQQNIENCREKSLTLLIPNCKKLTHLTLIVHSKRNII
jgi:hypothetical protein